MDNTPKNTVEQRKLYPFQEEAVNNIFGKLLVMPPNANLLFQLPTGGGKTIIFSEIARRYIQQFNKKILILTHRIELSKQTNDVLTEMGIANKIINSEVKALPQQSEYQSFTALVETLNNRLQENDQFLEDLGLVIVDEAHNNSFRKIFHYFSDVNILGVTATPLSSNKKLPLYQTYNDLIVGESIPTLIEKGYLCEGVTFSYDVNLSTLRVGNNGEFTVGSHELLYTQAMMQSKLVEAYEEVGKGTKTLIFNAGILTYGVFHLPLFFLVNKTFGLPGARAFAGFWRSGLTLGCSGSLLLLPLLLLLVLTLALTLTRL